MKELIKRPHPALVHFPVSLYPISLVFLILFWSLNDVFWLNAAFWCFIFAAIMVIPVSVTGVLDLFRLEMHPEHPRRTLNLHLLNGVIITAISLIGGLYFFMNRPSLNEGLLAPFSMIVGVLALLVMVQGYLGALMVYQEHLGIDGETR